MRLAALYLLRGVTAVTVACAVLVTLVSAAGLIFIVTGATSLANDLSVTGIAGGWLLSCLGLLSVARLGYLGARALGGGAAVGSAGGPADRG